LKYDATKQTTYETYEVCEWGWEWDPIEGEYVYKLICRQELKPKSVLLKFNIDGAAFKKVLWTWNLYNTELDLVASIELKSDGITYNIDIDEHEGNAKTIVETWTAAPDVDINNPGGFTIESADLYFKTRGITSALTHVCN